MYITFLPIRNRFLYLLYTNELTSIIQYNRYFSENELLLLPNILHQLQLEQIILKSYDFYIIHNIHFDTFLHIIDIIYHESLPMSRQEIREKIKNKDLNTILTQLIQSQILFEYRPQVSKKIYLILSNKKESDIKLIEEYIIHQLQQSDKFGDKTHLKMLQQHQDISSSYSNTNIDIHIPHQFTKWEKKIIQHLYNGLFDKIHHTISYNEEYITNNIFDGNIKQSQQTILQLIDKGILRSTYRNNYYLNNQILSQLKQFQKSNE